MVWVTFGQPGLRPSRSVRRSKLHYCLRVEKRKASEKLGGSEKNKAGSYAFCTLPLFRQLAQTRTRRCDP